MNYFADNLNVLRFEYICIISFNFMMCSIFVLNLVALILNIIFKNKFIYLFLAVLGLRCCTWAFSSCSERGLPFVAVSGLLVAVTSLVVEHGL